LQPEQIFFYFEPAMKGIVLLFSIGLFAFGCAAQKGILIEGAEIMVSPGKLYLDKSGFSLGVGICAQYERQFEFQWSVYSKADYMVFIKSKYLEIMTASIEAGLEYYPAIGGGHDIHTLRNLGKTGWFLNAGSGCMLAILSLGSHGSKAAAELFDDGAMTTKINPSFSIGCGYQTSQYLQFGFHGVLIGDFPHIWYAAGFRVMTKIFK
jgi:hypothetical protein